MFFDLKMGQKVGFGLKLKFSCKYVIYCYVFLFKFCLDIVPKLFPGSPWPYLVQWY